MLEIEVFGGGIFGLAIAYACRKRGARVRLIEKRHIGAGSSGGTVGALAPHTPDNWNAKKQFQFESLVLAEAFWREVDETSGQSSGYGRTGRVSTIEDERALNLARARADSARHCWQGKAEWSVVDCSRFEGWAPQSNTGFLVHDTLSARMSPLAACQSLAKAFTAIGGTLLEQTTTGKGADICVLATGWEGLADLGQELGRTIGKGIKGQSLSLDYNAAAAPQIYTNGMHIIPHADGTVAVGSTSESAWQDPNETDLQLNELHERAIDACQVLKDAPVLRRWAGVRPRAQSRAPLLGPHPERANTFIANGGFKIGFGMAPRVAETMADLIFTGKADLPESFSIEASLK